jgi:hypothetical protein
MQEDRICCLISDFIDKILIPVRETDGADSDVVGIGRVRLGGPGFERADRSRSRPLTCPICEEGHDVSKCPALWEVRGLRQPQNDKPGGVTLCKVCGYHGHDLRKCPALGRYIGGGLKDDDRGVGEI